MHWETGNILLRGGGGGYRDTICGELEKEIIVSEK